MASTPVTATATEADAQYVFDEWHRCVIKADVDALIALYTDDAVVETPTAVVRMNRESGLLSGKEQVAAFLRENFKERQKMNSTLDTTQFYRSGVYQFNGRTLTWEYPRKTPAGDAVDISEVLDLQGPKIQAHRMYFGWFTLASLSKRTKS